MLRADAETEFLAVSLPDAIAASLSGIDSLVVRSSVAAGRYAGEHVDLATIAKQMDVDSILTGTLLRADDRIRLTTQLVEAPAGTLIWSHTMQVQLGDLFRLQDDLARGIVESLSLPLSRRERSLLTRDVPATAKAYEFYLRANQLALSVNGWLLAKDLYVECVQEDPRYAPAWARLGRIYRLLAKYGGEAPESNLRLAQAAFARALELNPDLPLAHNLYASLEVELGRPIDAMTRLLQQAAVRRADPELFAGLVLACRYCGLLDASLAAHAEAHRLDATVRTSVSYTYWMIGDYQRAIAQERDEVAFMRGYGLSSLGRVDEALAFYRDFASREVPPVARALLDSQRAALEGDRRKVLACIRTVVSSGFRDPEGLYFSARGLAHLGELGEAMVLLDRVVAGGFYPLATLMRDPWLDTLRSDASFQALIARVAACQRQAAAVFDSNRGPLLLSGQTAG